VPALIVLIVGAHLTNEPTFHDVPLGAAKHHPIDLVPRYIRTAPLNHDLVTSSQRVIDAPDRLVDKVEFTPIARQMLCTTDWFVPLRQKVMDDIGAEGATQRVQIA